jgi:hypothetical protein
VKRAILDESAQQERAGLELKLAPQKQIAHRQNTRFQVLVVPFDSPTFSLSMLLGRPPPDARPTRDKGAFDGPPDSLSRRSLAGPRSRSRDMDYLEGFQRPMVGMDGRSE